MIEKGDYLKLKLDNLFVRRGSNDYTIPLSDISMIIVENQDAIITTRLMDAFTQYNIGLVICDYKHQPSGIFTGLNTNSRCSKVLRMQLDWTDEFKNEVWTHIIKGKITNQKNVLKKVNEDENNERMLLLKEYLDEIQSGDTTNREGHAAKVYFNTLFGNDFTRDNDDYINACLNYLYAIVRAFISRLVVAYGFTGLLGVHHRNEYNNFNLVDDLIEPFRPFCDLYIIENLMYTEVFSFDVRMKLVDFLNSKIRYNNQNVIVCSAIERYIISFMNCCKTGCIDELIIPVIDNEQV